MDRRVYLFFLSMVLFSCNDRQDEWVGKNEVVIKKANRSFDTVTKGQEDMINDSIIKSNNLVDIQVLNPAIFVDLKYASTDNFTGIKLYERITRAYLQKDVAIRLSNCQKYLSSLNPDLHLLVYDALRPVSVQQKMWDALDSIPVSERGKFVSNPSNHSIHNYGAAVDLTICDSKGVPLDMGAKYDEIGQIAYPKMEQYYLETGALTQQQVENRKLLRKVLQYQGFTNIPTEWWHFNAYSRKTAKEKYEVLLLEP